MGDAVQARQAKTESIQRTVAQKELSDSAQKKIVVEHLTVLPDRLEARVRIVDPRYRTTTPKLIERIVEQFPTLPYHTCRNEFGPTFGAVMEKTSVPHLLEHVVIDIQTHEHAQSVSRKTGDEKVVFTGTTQWSADDPDVAIVRVSFLDDLIALSAFKKALNSIEQALA